MAAERIISGGAPEGFDARLLIRELGRGQPVIHVARDDKRMEAMRAALAVMAPGTVVLECPAWDCLPYDRVSPNPTISARRMSTLTTLAAQQRSRSGQGPTARPGGEQHLAGHHPAGRHFLHRFQHAGR